MSVVLPGSDHARARTAAADVSIQSVLLVEQSGWIEVQFSRGERVMDATAMVEQLLADERLQRRLSRPWVRVVVLERLARGGGATEWYVAESRAEFEEIVRRLRPGAAVSFYFADQIPAGRLSGELRAELDRLVRATGEVIVGRRTGEGPSIDMEIISGPLELAEFLDGFPVRMEVFWGTWPGRDDDGTDAVSVVLVDADGVLRAHPH